MMMQSTIAWPPPYTVRKHKLAKHVKLRASSRHGLAITIPYRMSLKHIPSILEEHKDWIVENLLKLDIQKESVLPDHIQLNAVEKKWSMQYEACDKKIELIQRPQGDIVLIGKIDDHALCKQYLVAWIKYQARQFLFATLGSISQETGLSYESVTLRDQQTVWGSCTSRKTISLNYKLIFLPPHLVRYVLIHELCHTKHLNHSARFWDLVGLFDAQYLSHRQQLRKANQWIPSWI